MTLAFAVVLALSAFLIFWIQPLVAKMLLPALGGAPAVWATTVLFFQGALLLGYLYAHGMARLPFRLQGLVHGLILVVAILVLPTGPMESAAAPAMATATWVLFSLALYVGLPFAVLSSSAPLLQHWFGRGDSKGAADPYFLYAASNTGSFVALISFPTVLERYYAVPDLASMWRASFVIAAAGIAVCFGLASRRATSGTRHVVDAGPRAGTPQVLRWLALAFIPSSLMLGVTTHITTDIAAVSLFWTLPLALYLATFVLAFSKYGATAARIARLLLPFLLFVLVALVFWQNEKPVVRIPVELAIVTFISMVLHSMLYQSRPNSSLLTSFYLWLAFGGFLGGLLNGFIAPLIFSSLIEYPLVLLLGLLVAEWPFLRIAFDVWSTASWRGFEWRNLAIILPVAVAFAWWATGLDTPREAVAIVVLVSVSLLAASFAFGALLAGRMVATTMFVVYLCISIFFVPGHSVYSARTYFGAFLVFDSEEGSVAKRMFVHGTTVHGIQAKDPGQALAAQSYYRVASSVFADFLSGRPGGASIAVVGLGSGTLACAARAGDTVTFFEIDPEVEYIARHYFSYLDECPGDNEVVLGDARLTLTGQPDNRFDILVLDAYSSDGMPVHLITDEAAQIYERVLKPDGLMAFHISNRYVDLAPVILALANHRNWSSWEMNDHNAANDPLLIPSTYVLAATSEEANLFLSHLAIATPLESATKTRLWTDDYSNLLAILRW
ncbi:MAG TPA: fused MFS/spermidine synthase [Woeseiaceae bacterium]|nr:fused MFS/spermidine synthase [Woeseiaceae bacterium]